jgi:hypothetical protein
MSKGFDYNRNFRLSPSNPRRYRTAFQPLVYEHSGQRFDKRHDFSYIPPIKSFGFLGNIGQAYYYMNQRGHT